MDESKALLLKNLKELITKVMHEGEEIEGLTIEIKGSFNVLLGEVKKIDLGDDEYAVIPLQKQVLLYNPYNNTVYLFTLDTGWLSFKLD